MREEDIMGIKRGVMDETLGHVTTLASKSRRAKDREREVFHCISFGSIRFEYVSFKMQEGFMSQ